MNKFLFFEHPADIKFKATGKSLNELFENSALAFSSYLSDKKIKTKQKKKIQISARDNESLLYSFMDELIFLLDAENFALSKAKVKINGNELKANLEGDDAKSYKIKHIKAATYAEMFIKQLENKTWECQMVLDV